jgi:hypothetical protein
MKMWSERNLVYSNKLLGSLLWQTFVFRNIREFLD